MMQMQAVVARAQHVRTAMYTGASSRGRGTLQHRKAQQPCAAPRFRWSKGGARGVRLALGINPPSARSTVSARAGGEVSARAGGEGGEGGGPALVWDVVAVAGGVGAEDEVRLGVVVDLLSGGELEVEVLEQAPDEEGGESGGVSNEWKVDHSREREVWPADKIKVVEHYYGERMVMDRVSNPHGEHAEGVWEVAVEGLEDIRAALAAASR